MVPNTRMQDMAPFHRENSSQIVSITQANSLKRPKLVYIMIKYYICVSIFSNFIIHFLEKSVVKKILTIYYFIY